MHRPARSGTLGAVLAGGRSSRFGSDKALALLAGRTLLEHAVAALESRSDAVVIVGREGGIADWPRPGMGPLGGLAAALRHAVDRGFSMVLSIPVDAVVVPPDLVGRLAPPPAFAVGQPVVGLWPVSAAAAIEELLGAPGRHAMRDFAAAINARPVSVDLPANVNTPADLARLAAASASPA